MTTCKNCKFAVWRETKAGRLHPDKSGKCTRLVQHPLDLRLPVAFYWLGTRADPPKPYGGYIFRDQTHAEECAFKAC